MKERDSGGGRGAAGSRWPSQGGSGGQDSGRHWGQPLLCLLCLLPLAWFFQQAAQLGLGPDPGREVALFTGRWTLRFLLLTLAVRPLQTFFPRYRILRYRRTLGLFTLGYASVHLLAWFGLLLNFELMEFAPEVMRNPYVLVGMSAWLLLLPLGLTSTRAAMRRLGRRWRLLHRLVYLVAILAIIHFLWLSKDISRPLFYALLLGLLFGVRIFFRFQGRFAGRRS